MVDEAAEAADVLSARNATGKNEGSRAARLRRNRLLKMIRERLAKIRKIVRFTFAILIFTSEALWTFDEECPNSPKRNCRLRDPAREAGLTGVRVETERGFVFLRLAGAHGPSGKYKDSISMMMVLGAVVHSNASLRNKAP